MIIAENYNSFKYNIRYNFLCYLPHFFYHTTLKYFYRKKFSRNLNLKNPKRFSEKICWSILYDKNPLRTVLTDKLQAKNYVSKLIPELGILKVYQVSDSFEKLTFDFYPKTFVLKTNHAWKTNILVEDKEKFTREDYFKCKKYYKKVLNINYAYWGTPELQYKGISPQIYAEEFLCSTNDNAYFYEYEVYCFKGKPEFINYVVSCCDSPNLDKIDRDLVQTQVFDTKWNQVDFKIRFDNNLTAPDTPNRQKILEYATILSNGFDFVRIDFFEVDNKLYFGEFTFSPYSGFIQFIPDKYDFVFGEKC